MAHLWIDGIQGFAQKDRPDPREEDQDEMVSRLLPIHGADDGSLGCFPRWLFLGAFLFAQGLDLID